MRYFFFLSGLVLIGALSCMRLVPVYDLSVERSSAVLHDDGSYSVGLDSPKNIWYIGLSHLDQKNSDICVEWDINQEKKTECIDPDGGDEGHMFTFPVLSSAVSAASFRIRNHPNLSTDDIVVYSLNTQASGSQLAFELPGTFAENGIISRKEWGADETLRYVDNPKWQTKYAATLEYIQRPKTQLELDSIQVLNERAHFLRVNYGANTETTSLTRTEGGHLLVWPIEKVKQISRIVIHHTAESLDSNKSDEDMIRGIYAYHTLSNEWGDIGYNYLVGQRGKIYEGRAGGDYTVAAHALYNNMGTVGISILGNYNKNHLNADQIIGIEKVVSMMASKYGITLSDTKKGVIKCDTPACYPFQIVSTKSLIGHQDVGRTDCPGSDVESRIPSLIARLDRPYSPVYNPIQGTIDPIRPELVMNMTLKKVTLPTAPLVMPPPAISVAIPAIRYIGPKFRVKLSYPDEKNVVLATADGKMGKLTIDKRRIPMKVSQKIQVGVVGTNQISLQIGVKYFTGSELKLAHTVVRVDSWDRVPDWDKSGKYNDNLFRDTVRVLNQNGKLLVTNDLPIEWYLRGLGEVSNTDLPEKIKVITVAARSYARYYLDPKNRKFGTSLYDGSDNPDEFQKYLGYSYELRSPNVVKMVDLTRNQVITYQGKLIKPWYHSSSDGTTLSALSYCQKNGSSNCVDIPYLQSVVDPGGVGHTRAGHGVGISGIGATYWATAGWDYKKIIQYYLQGVEVLRK